MFFVVCLLSDLQAAIKMFCEIGAFLLREKCPNTKLFLVRIFLYLDLIQRFDEQISIFSPNTGKYRPEITPYLNTLHAVSYSQKS